MTPLRFGLVGTGYWARITHAPALAGTELAAGARSGQADHPCDVRFGRDVVRVLARAQRQLDARRAG